MWHSQSVRNLKSSSSNSFCSFLGAQRTQNVKCWEEGGTINEITKTNSHYRKINTSINWGKENSGSFFFRLFISILLFSDAKGKLNALHSRWKTYSNATCRVHSTACCDENLRRVEFHATCWIQSRRNIHISSASNSSIFKIENIFCIVVLSIILSASLWRIQK